MRSLSLSLPSQAKQDELEELNKELRQCNLQQFIQQTGVLPAHSHSRTELQEQLEQLELAHLLQESYSNGGVAAKTLNFTIVDLAWSLMRLFVSHQVAASLRWNRRLAPPPNSSWDIHATCKTLSCPVSTLRVCMCESLLLLPESTPLCSSPARPLGPLGAPRPPPKLSAPAWWFLVLGSGNICMLEIRSLCSYL